MISNSARDTAALDLIRKAMAQVLLRLRLIGLTYLGRSIVVREDETAKTLCTNGRVVMYSPTYVKTLQPLHVEMALVHEWLHVFGNDVMRGVGRDRDLWGIAVDIHVNGEVARMFGAKIPPTWIQPEAWARDMSKEQIYEELLKNERTPAKGTDLVDDLVENAHEDLEEFVEDFRGDLAGAMEIVKAMESADQMKARYGGKLLSRFEKIMRPTVPWGRLVRGRLDTQLRGRKLSWAKPNIRHWPDMVLPTYRGSSVPILVIGVDVSASVDQHSMNQFASNVAPAAALARQCYVVTFDAAVREVVKTNRPRDVLKQVKFLQGRHSHTDARGVFEVAERVKATAVVVETDGAIMLPDKPFPETTWVLNNEVRMPWGKSYVMERGW